MNMNKPAVWGVLALLLVVPAVFLAQSLFFSANQGGDDPQATADPPVSAASKARQTSPGI